MMRDYAQRAVGNWVIALTGIAALLTYFIIGERIGIASGIAFAISESIDWLIYRLTEREFKDRILISSAVAVPFDGVIFLGIMGWMDWQHFGRGKYFGFTTGSRWWPVSPCGFGSVPVTSATSLSPVE